MQLPLDSIGAVHALDTGIRWDGPEIAEEAARRARWLADQGIGRGDKVLLLHGGSAEFFADLFAIWRCGACAVGLNPGLTRPELEVLVKFLDPSGLLVGTESPAVDPVGDLAPWCLAEETGDEKVSDAAVVGGDLDDEALILFTSGTTGDPKGVVHTFRSLLARFTLNQAHMPADALRQTLCPLPTHFGHGLIGNCLTPLLAGCDVTLMKGSDPRVVAALGQIIDEHGITFLSSVPAFWKIATKMAKPPADGSLRRVHIGSAPLSADLWQRIAEWCGTRDVFNMYGITETANWIGGASFAKDGAGDGLIGRVWGGRAAVLLPDGAIVSTGEGELLVQTPSLMAGYYQRPDLTAPVLKNGWFHTGDIGTVSEDGVMRLTGRAKYEINRAGLKVHPEDIDILLEQHTAVQEACAFGLADPIAGETVGVAVCLAEGAGGDDDRDMVKALRTWCSERLSREKVPEKWFVVDDIPKTDRGKINRDVVARHCLAQADADRAAAE